MRVTFLGTGSALPTGDRFQTGLLLEHDPQTEPHPENGRSGPLLIDCGSGVVHALARTDVGYEGISTVLLTHHHLDHVSDLLVLLKARWLAGTEQLTVVGPRGTRALLDDLCSAHEYLYDKVEFTVQEVEPGSFECGGFDVEAIETRHSMDCLAYRFTEDDATFTFSGDSEAFDALGDLADGSDVLAHDCSFPDEIDVSNHPTPTQLGETLTGRTIGQVVLTHLYPHTDGHHAEMLNAIQNHYDGDVRFAHDGLCIEL